MWEAVGFIVALAISWPIFNLVTTYFCPEKYACLLLRREARDRSVDLSTIPEPAWDEIASRIVALAKAMAQLDGQKLNWRLVLVDYIELDATCIATIMSGWVGQGCETTRQTLLKYGVKIDPAA
jgi:hypothetical protein